eukprot:4972373-Heterocapsa_arctica.AAC.1
MAMEHLCSIVRLSCTVHAPYAVACLHIPLMAMAHVRVSCTVHASRATCTAVSCELLLAGCALSRMLSNSA